MCEGLWSAYRMLGVHTDGFLLLQSILFTLRAGSLIALSTELHKRLRLNVEPRNIAVHNSLPDHSKRSFRAEVVLVVELVHHLHHVLGRQSRVLDVSHLVPASVFHLLVGDEVVALGEVVELRTRIS